MDERSDERLAADRREGVARALAEDVGAGDLTATLVPASQHSEATVVCREAAVLCGRDWFEEVFRQLDAGIAVRWRAREGETMSAGAVVCELGGLARPMLTGERTALNFLQTLSGTATATREYVEAVTGTKSRILDTRKTLPGLRLAQKYAVRVGGGTNHRIGLHDGILVKENHIVAAGGISAAVGAARAQGTSVLLEVEVENLEQAEEALRAGADRLLLDNITLDEMREAVALRDKIAPAATLEASGGIDLRTVRNVALTGVDFISVGSLTKNLRAVDFSMRFRFGA